jgi:hypothetical protein
VSGTPTEAPTAVSREAYRIVQEDPDLGDWQRETNVGIVGEAISATDVVGGEHSGDRGCGVCVEGAA